MEAGMTGAPAAAEPAQTEAPAPEQVAPEQAAPQPDPLNPFPPQQEQAETDVAAQLAAMEERVKAAEAQLAEAQGPQPTDLVSALLGEEGEPEGLTPEQVAASQGGQEDPGEAQQELAELDAYVQERVQAALDPIVRERQDDQLRAFQEKNPDIMQPEIFDKVAATLDNFVARYGDNARVDVGLVEMAYKAVKAEQADTGAVPAGQAAQHGASIETQAGQNQGGEPSVEEQYEKSILSGGSGSVFE